jgi:ABC-type phosphate transport system substrate-binding protein
MAALTNMRADAQSALNSISNSQTVQDIRNGPAMDKARTEMNQTQNEFGNLANARVTPTAQTATGQNLTHYHSFFYNLLSWENPRATALSYVSVVLAILAWRYLPIVRYSLRILWIVLGISAAAEVAGALILGQGFSSKIRPKKYYTISRETLEAILGDTEEFINFFVIEFQRVIFAENVYVTIGVWTLISDYVRGLQDSLTFPRPSSPPC